MRRDGADPAVALSAARAAQSHVGLAQRLARDAGARERRTAVLSIARRIRGVGDAVLAAGELVDVAKAEAVAATQERDAAEKAELLRALGVAEGETLPPRLRSQLSQLEDDQKRRATRHQRDVLDRAMVDLLSLYRDVLVVQLGAERRAGERGARRHGARARRATPRRSRRCAAWTRSGWPAPGWAATWRHSWRWRPWR